MIQHDANDLFRQARDYLQGATEDGTPCEKNLDKAERLLNEILSHNLGNFLVLYMLGSLNLERGNYGLAIQLLSTVTQIKPKFGEAWNNLGLAFRGVNNWDMGAECAAKAMEYIDHPDIAHNVSGMYLGRNMPEKALHYTNIALSKNPDHVRYRWHKALALLEMRKWDEAWDYHDARLDKGGNEEIGLRNYHGPDGMTPTWDGVSKGTIAVHGEQGMGDEIMFASVLPDLIATGNRIIFEPSPRMEAVFKTAFPTIHVRGTNDTDGRAWIEELGRPDFKVALGSLGKFFRRSESAFPGTPYLKPDPAKRAWWGDKLKALGRKPNIGLAWQGGVAVTRVDNRSFHPGYFAPLFEACDANWISLQYDETAQHCVNEVWENQKVRIHHWPKAVAQKDPDTGKISNLDELVALVSKLDMVITVCQTAVHVAGALGIPTLCLVPSEPSWRYGAGESTKLPWYRSVTLIRQPKGTDDWSYAIQKAADQLQLFLAQRKTA